MFWSSPKLPVTSEEKEWIESSLLWLSEVFGAEFLLKQQVILPEAAFFPDKFHGTQDCVWKLAERVCVYMQTDPKLIEVEIFSDLDDTAKDHRLGESEHSGAAGLYFSQTNAGPAEENCD